MYLFTISYKINRIILLCCLFVLAFSCISGDLFAKPGKNASQAKKMLSARLDSIEMEKQIRKRKGESLEDLEIESKKIYDSITVLRTELSGYADPVSASEEEPDKGPSFSFSLRSLIKPVNFFDWIIIIVGLVALLSGIILVAGLTHTLSIRKKKKPPPSAHILPKKLDAKSVPDMPVDVPPLVQGDPAEKETRGITTIRQRMQSVGEQVQKEIENISPFSELEQADEQSEKEDQKNSIRNNIIQAAKEGLDVHEISRKYHISVDQVALILRVAGGGHKKE